MSIQSEITRLQNAKTALKTAIENKGVTVPINTKLDGYANLVDSIETGSDGRTLTKFTLDGLNETVFLDSMILKKSGQPIEPLQEAVDYEFDPSDTISFLRNIEGILMITLLDINTSASYDIALTIG